MVEPRKGLVDGNKFISIQLQRDRQRRQLERERHISEPEDDRCGAPKRTQSFVIACNQPRAPGPDAPAIPRRKVQSQFLNCACLCRAVVADRIKALNQATAELEKKTTQKKKTKKAGKSKGKKGGKRASKPNINNDTDADAEKEPRSIKVQCCTCDCAQNIKSERREGFRSKLLPQVGAPASAVIMCDRVQPSARRSSVDKSPFAGPPVYCPLPCPPPCPPPCPNPCPPCCPPPCPPPSSPQQTLRNPSRRKSADDTPGKRMKNFNNQQKRTDTTYTCTCNTCNNNVTCCCVEDLEVIEEEHDCAEDLCSPYVETTVQGHMQGGPSGSQRMGVDQKRDSSSVAGEEDDPCGEFFDIMRETMEDAVKKTLDCVFNQHFGNLLEKMDGLCCQMERNECIISKIYNDLNDKISYYGERNAQQFQYLCVRMEHDRLFYQQQQEYFLKAVAKCPQALDPSGSQSPSQQDEAEVASMRCTLQKSPTQCGNDDMHSKTKTWDCTLQMNDGASQQCDEEDEGESTARRSKTRSNPNIGRRSDSAGTNDGKGAFARSKKK